MRPFRMMEDDDSVLHDRVPHGHGSDYRHGAEGAAVRGYGMEGAAVGKKPCEVAQIVDVEADIKIAVASAFFII